jgi:hypothetical protein
MPTGLWLYAYYVFVALIVLEALLMIAVLRQITALHSHFVTNDRMTLTQDFPWVRWREQVNALNAALRGHYASYGIAVNFRFLQMVQQAVERYRHKMLCSRSWAERLTWDMFHQIKQRQPILRPKVYLPYGKLQALAVL